MKLRLVPAKRGVLWVQQAFQVFFKQPLAFTALFFLFMFSAFMLMVLPGIGSLAVLTLLPIVTLGFMIGTQRAIAGETAMQALFVLRPGGIFHEALRSERSRFFGLLQLGIAYAIASLLVMLLADLIDGGRLEQIQEAMMRSGNSPAAVDESDAQAALGLRMLLALPLSILFWHSPALVHWCGVSAIKSVFFSVVACWRNKAAFLMYGLTWFAVIALFGVLSTAIFSLLQSPELISLMIFPAALMFSTVFYASLYFTFVDCFELEEPQLPQGPEEL
jgi:hypothetical protein